MIRILVDTAADYTMEEIKEKGFELVPMHITIGEKDYRDAIDLTKDQFYQLLTESGDFSKTSQPTPQDFVEAFEDVKEKGDELICILLSSALSGTCQSAALAKSIVDYDKIHIVDSLTATHMIRVLADHAKKLAEEGVSAEKIVEELNDLKPRVQVFAALDTLEYLYKGGRVSRTSAVIGEVAKIKPVIHVSEDGRVIVVAKCMGKNKAITTLLKLLGERKLDESFPIYSVYTYGEQNVEALEARMEEEGYHVQERQQIGATIGTHIGPGVFGAVFVEK